MRVILIGGGEVVYFLARTFLSKGYHVSIINDSAEECERLAMRLKALIVHGDGSDPDFLDDAKARESQVLIAVTPHDHINLVCCQTASLRFNIPRTVALVNDPDNFDIFKELGISHIFNQTDLIVSMIEKQARYENVSSLLEYEEGNVLINEVRITSKMPANGTAIGDLELPQGASIIGITRSQKFHLKDDQFRIQEGDLILLLANPKILGSTLRVLCGEEA